jgi:hypothetical protein
MGKADCQYALRKLFNGCNTIKDEFRAGDFTYRCVTYRVGLVERSEEYLVEKSATCGLVMLSDMYCLRSHTESGAEPCSRSLLDYKSLRVNASL